MTLGSSRLHGNNVLASRCASTIRPSLIMSFSSGNRHQRCKKHSFAPRTIATATASCCCKCKPICQILNAIVMISLSPVTLTGISMRLACLYTTARLFINCPNETKWEISSEVRKVFLILAVCCILLGAGSIYGLYRYIEPQLPDVATLKDVRLQIPMQFTAPMAS